MDKESIKMKTAEQIFYNKLVHYNPKDFPKGMKKAIYRAMEEYASQAIKEKDEEIEELKKLSLELLIPTAVKKSSCEHCKGTGQIRVNEGEGYYFTGCVMCNETGEKVN